MLRAYFTPKEVSIEVDPCNAVAEKAIEKALAKLGLTLVEAKKAWREEAPGWVWTVMLFRKE